MEIKSFRAEGRRKSYVLEDITYAERNLPHIMDLSHKFKSHGSFGADSSSLEHAYRRFACLMRLGRLGSAFALGLDKSDQNGYQRTHRLE